MRDDFATQKQWIEGIYDRYHDRQYVSYDPLAVVLRHDDPADREVVGLIAALLAYGNVKAMLAGIEGLLDRIGDGPAERLANGSSRDLNTQLADFRYRVTDQAAMIGLLRGVKHLRREFGSLHKSFLEHVDADDRDILPAAARWRVAFVKAAGHPLDHLLPDPAKTSACKRLMLYFRWMARRDAIDQGDWTAISPAKLIAPVDTHLHRVALQVGWTTRKQITLATARDVTAALRRFDPDDPLRFDFALTRPGILKQSPFPGQTHMAIS
jgi:uncharacterized protein (TIGR02757 family)